MTICALEKEIPKCLTIIFIRILLFHGLVFIYNIVGEGWKRNWYMENEIRLYNKSLDTKEKVNMI